MGDSQNSITSEQLTPLIGTTNGPVIVDVRRRPAFNDSTRIIEGATWRDPEQMDAWAGDVLGGRAADAEIVVYCVHGHEVSQGAASALRALGLNAVYLEGGIEGHIDGGGATVAK